MLVWRVIFIYASLAGNRFIYASLAGNRFIYASLAGVRFLMWAGAARPHKKSNGCGFIGG